MDLPEIMNYTEPERNDSLVPKSEKLHADIEDFEDKVEPLPDDVSLLEQNLKGWIHSADGSSSFNKYPTDEFVRCLYHTKPPMFDQIMYKQSPERLVFIFDNRLRFITYQT